MTFGYYDDETIPYTRKPQYSRNPVCINSEIAKLVYLKQEAWEVSKTHR